MDFESELPDVQLEEESVLLISEFYNWVLNYVVYGDNDHSSVVLDLPEETTPLQLSGDLSEIEFLDSYLDYDGRILLKNMDPNSAVPFETIWILEMEVDTLPPGQYRVSIEKV